jgi:hypothetical protein
MNTEFSRSVPGVRIIARWSLPVILCMGLIAVVSCSGRQAATTSSQTNSNGSPKSPPKDPSGQPPLATKNTTFRADPNPIQVCDGSGLGITSLIYDSEGPTAVQVQVGSPNGVGGLLAHSGPKGSAKTGKWVSNGLTFYLQDASQGRTSTPENTLATVTVRVTNVGCP